MGKFSSQNSFTLIELLIVIGILAILVAAVVVVLNPAQLLAQARDSKRQQDLSALTHALNTITALDQTTFFGTSSIVYASLPDSSSTCGSWSLPTLPSGWSYHCVATSSLQNTDGTGWIPVNIKANGVINLSALPTDPQNTSSTGLYYTYVTGGSFQLAAHFESTKYQATQGSDAMYTVGSNLTLAPFLSGLVGWWKFDETGTSTIFDSSGYNLSGVMWQGNTSGVDFHTLTGCKLGSGCFLSNGVDSYAQLPNITSSRSGITVSGWVKKNIGNVSTVVRAGGNYWYLDFENGATTLRFGVNAQWSMSNSGYPDNGAWHFVLGTFDGLTVKRYVDGSLIGQSSYAYSIPSVFNATISGAATKFGYASINGLVDDVRIYNRALSASEIQALYNATK